MSTLSRKGFQNVSFSRTNVLILKTPGWESFVSGIWYSNFMDLPSNSNVILFSPHPDDESIAAGGLITDLRRRGNRIFVYFFANSPKGVADDLPEEEKIRIRQSEASAACAVLGADASFFNFDNPSLEITPENIERVKQTLEERKPSLVITLSEYERHPTHRNTTKIVEAAMDESDVPLWFGEVWTPLLDPDYVHLLDDEAMDIKYKALKQYTSQLKRTSWADAAKALATYRALTSSEMMGNFGRNEHVVKSYAEVFKIKKP
jgi:LmbE family N-acetylglucosaminyl deacetylase